MDAENDQNEPGADQTGTGQTGDERAVLDGAAGVKPFYALADEGDFPPEHLDYVASLIEDSSWVRAWLDRALLLFGLTLVTVGVVFFFAFNWDQLPRLAKLGVVQVGFAGALVAATLRDLHSVTARVLLVVAGVLVGVFLAVFGQVYQTGADDWQLFALWSTVLLPLALLAGTQGAWVLFGAVAATTGITGVDEFIAAGSPRTRDFLQMLAVLVMSVGVLATTEWLRHRGAGLVEEFPWSRSLLLTTGFGALTIDICAHHGAADVDLLAAGIALLVVVGLLVSWFYTAHKPDIVGAGIVGLSWLVVLVRFVGEWAFDAIESGLAGFFFMSVFTLLLTVGMVATLRKLTAVISERSGEAG
jgi:uncharacterized membrane protein